MSSSATGKARRSLTEQFEMIYGAPPTASTGRPSTRSPSGQIGPYRAVSPQQQYRSSVNGSTVDGINSVAFLHETMRTHATELELERRTREAAVRDLSARTTVEVGELREMIKQLRQENSTMKEQLWTLERRKVSPSPNGIHGGAYGDGYFGGHAALANVQMPLIPRVTDLETSVDQLKQKVSALQLSDKAREEALQKALVDQQLQQREALDTAKDYVRSECDRRDAARIDPLEQHVRDVVAQQQDMQRAMAQRQADNAAVMGQLEGRIKGAEGAISDMQHDRTSQHQMDEWRRAAKAASDAEGEKVRSMIADVKADIAKATRKQEAGDVDVQEALQSFVSQRIEVIRAEMLPREELAKIANMVSSTQKDVDRATDAAQGAKIAAEETKRELAKRVAALEADESALTARLSQVSSDVTGAAQTAKAAANSVDELRAGLKANQLAISEGSDRITGAVTKQLEHAGLIDTISQDLARLKAVQASNSTTEVSERQAIKDRLAAAEDEVKTLKHKLASLDDAQQQHKKDADRALNDLRSSVGAEERANNQLSQQKMLNAVASLEAKVASVDDRCGAFESAATKQREELLAAMRAKIEDTKEALNARVAECDDACKGRHKETKEAVARAEEKSANAATKTKHLEAAVESLPTANDVEKAVLEAKESLNKVIARNHQDNGKETNAIREDMAQLRAANEKSIADMQTDLKARTADVCPKAMVEELRLRVEDVSAALDQSEANMNSGIHKAVRDRLKPLQDAQGNQKEEFDEFQTLVAELAQRLKATVATVDEHTHTLVEHDKAIEASDKSAGSILNELMMAVSVACSHEQQFGPSSNANVNGSNVNGSVLSTNTALTPAVTIKSMGDVVQYILNCVADAQQEQHDHLAAMEANNRALTDQQQQQIQDQIEAAFASRPRDEPSITEDDVHAAMQTVSGPLMELTKIVDRHEVGFSAISELVQGIRFNNKSIIAVASAVGVDTEGLKLRTLDDSELQEALSEAAADNKDREIEITERERNWM